MGVLGLWQILESVGHPIKLEGLEGKRLGVDANVWLYKFIRGFREKDNATSIDSHKLGLFNRISKLLFYKIKPVFIFDGPAPVLKRRTLERRQNVRSKQLAKVQTAAMRLLAEQLKGQYPQADLDQIKIGLPSLASHNLAAAEKFTDEDRALFYLPPEVLEPDGDDTDDEAEVCEDVKFTDYLPPKVDVESEDFANLPAEIRYEILVDIKDQRKKLRKAQALPEDAQSFSNLQLERLKNRRNIQEKIEKCEKDIQSAYGSLFTDFELCRSSRKVSQPPREEVERRQQHDPLLLPVFISEADVKPGSATKIVKPKDEGPALGPQLVDPFKADTSFGHDSTFRSTPDLSDASSDSDSSPSGPSSPAKSSDTELLDEEEQQSSPVPEAGQKRSTKEMSTILLDSSDSETDIDKDRKSETAEMEHEPSVVILDDEKKSPDEPEMELSTSSAGIPIPVDKEPTGKQAIEIKENHEVVELISDSGSSTASSPVLSTGSMSLADREKHLAPVELDTPEPKKIPLKYGDIEEDEFDSDIDEALIPSQPPPSSPKQTETQTSSQAIAAPQPQISHADLEKARSDAARNAAKVTTKIVDEAKELLRLFGIPYIDAAGEAEAQCASLEKMKLTEGTITDDSDVWLFGSQNVYRYFFNEDKYVMQYKMPDIEFHLKLDRENLVCFAMLVGSDYTDGIMNVGPVTALEILSEFQGDGLAPLVKFKKWREKYAKGDRIPLNKKREKLLKFIIPDGFPSRNVFEGYTRPVVDSSTEAFSWGMPDLDELREYARRNFAWDNKRIDEKLLPVMKKVSERRTQPTIDSFFFKTRANENPEMFRSKRVNQALSKIAKKTSSQSTVLADEELRLTESEDESSDVETAQPSRAPGRGRGRTKEPTKTGRARAPAKRGRAKGARKK